MKRLLALLLLCLPLAMQAQRELRLPLHHGCGELVYTRQEGWALRPDTTGTLHFPRTYVFEGEMGQGLRAVAEYDADSVLVRTWRFSPLTDGVCVEQAPYGRALYTFDSLGTLVSVRYQSMEGSPRPGPGMPFPMPALRSGSDMPAPMPALRSGPDMPLPALTSCVDPDISSSKSRRLSRRV